MGGWKRGLSLGKVFPGQIPVSMDTFHYAQSVTPGVFLPVAEEKRSPVHIAAKIVLGKTAAQAPAALGCNSSLFQFFAHFLSNTALRLLSEGSWIIPNQENMVSYQDRL